MGTRKPDKIEVIAKGGYFDRFSAVEIVNDITAPTEATFELGDQSAWEALRAIIAPGEAFEVRLNGRPRLKGRAEANEAPTTPDQGSRLTLTIRTKLADARYSSANSSLVVKDRSVKDVLVELYGQLGYTADDFVFAPFAARDLMTGKRPGGAAEVIDLEPIEADKAKVQIPEPIWDFSERHLKRYHATLWDAPDGRLVVGVPDDEQPPSYSLVSRLHPNGRSNNVTALRPIRDWGEVARYVTVYGFTPGGDVAKSRIRSVATDSDVDEVAIRTGHFNRLVVVSANQAKVQEAAAAIAARELSARRRRKNALEVSVDGWSHWTGTEQIPWANNTTADVLAEGLGGNLGRYLVVRVVLRYSEGEGTVAQLTLVAPGIWVL